MDIKQWGKDNLNNDGYGTISFPIAFTKFKYTFLTHHGTAPVAWNLNEESEAMAANMQHQYIRGKDLAGTATTYGFVWAAIGI